MKNIFIYHPLLFACLPVLSVFEINKNIIKHGQIFEPLLISIILMMIFYFVFGLFIKNKYRTAIFTSTFMVLFYMYGLILSYTQDLAFGGWLINNYNLALFFWIICVVFVAHIIAQIAYNTFALTTFFNISSLLIFLFLFGNLLLFVFRDAQASSQMDLAQEPATVNQTIDKEMPDIYYIILDEYARSDVLHDFFEYDNSLFLEKLNQRGFYVAAQSTANYLTTELSLASSLNISYIDSLVEKIESDRNSARKIHRLIDNNYVSDFLKSQGYKYYHFGSFWEATETNSNADFLFNYYWLSNSTWFLLRQTLLNPFLRFISFDYRREHYNRVLYQLEKLPQVANNRTRSFIFAHFIIPHGPYVFDSDGSFLTNSSEIRERSIKENYLGQITYINKAIIRVIDDIINNSNVPPIIIIQSDHGAKPPRPDENSTDIYIEHRMPILNAYFVPDEIKGNLYAEITPVNSFRLVFNYLFNKNLELLPDLSFYSFPDSPYRLYEITKSSGPEL